MEVAEKLRIVRRARGLTQQELADLVGVDKGHISKIESGKIKNPGKNVLKKITDELGLPLRAIAPDAWYEGETELSIEAATVNDRRLTEEQIIALLTIYKSFLPKDGTPN